LCDKFVRYTLFAKHVCLSEPIVKLW